MSPPSSGDAAPGSGRARHSSSGHPTPERALAAAFYERPADRVARELLGARLISLVDGVPCAAEIVETEAYTGPDDEASHAHIRFGRTPRNAAMFGPPGTAYVYLIYGLHWCINAVTGADGFPAAVLIRAARPLLGVDRIRARRPGRPERDLLRGPGNLSRGLAVDGALNTHRLTRAPLWIEPGAPVPDADVARGPRVGISRAVDAPLRFAIRGSRWGSAPALRAGRGS